MKKILSLFFIILSFYGCNKSSDDNGGEIPLNIDFRQEMRNFVIGLSQYSKNINQDFKIITQNGIDLISKNGTTDYTYTGAINAIAQENLNYGYNADDELTPANITSELSVFLDASINAGKTVYITDYCSSANKVADSYAKNNAKNYISFAANERLLNKIPTLPNPINGENSDDIYDVDEAKNFLYLIGPTAYSSKAEFIQAVQNTNYDVIIIDVLFNPNIAFTATDITNLKTKQNGGNRLVIAYMSVGEAESYRSYWNTAWENNRPSWLEPENPDWPGNYKVHYWEKGWQDVIYGNENSYLKNILNMRFDGTYLDIIDAFEYFEDL